MSEQKYRELIDQMCTTFDLGKPELMYASCDVLVSGISFTLSHGGEGDEGSLFIACDYGEPPQERLADVLRALLEVNLYFFAGGNGYFSVNPETGHVLMLRKVPLEGLAPPEVLATLMLMAGSANEWRDTHYLVDTMALARTTHAMPQTQLNAPTSAA